AWYRLAGPDGTAREVCVSGRAGEYQARCEDRHLTARIRCLAADELALASDGRTERIRWQRCGDRLALHWSGATRELRLLAAGAAAAAGTSERHITASLPGRVAEIHCAPGDSVTAGQTLI